MAAENRIMAIQTGVRMSSKDRTNLSGKLRVRNGRTDDTAYRGPIEFTGLIRQLVPTHGVDARRQRAVNEMTRKSQPQVVKFSRDKAK
jgi:hypothetical protein